MAYVPVNLLLGKIQVSYKGDRTLLKTDFGVHVVFGGNSTVLIKLDPHYKAKVYGLCGNFNGDARDEFSVTTPGSPSANTSVALAQAYHLSGLDHDYCTNCLQKIDKAVTLNEATMPVRPVSEGVSSLGRQCAVLRDPKGPLAHCPSQVDPASFYEGCVIDHVINGASKVASNQAMRSYSIVCEESDGYHDDVTVGK